VLGVRSAATAECLRDVPMSVPETGALTLQALHHNGIRVALAEELADVDTIGDIDAVRRACPPDSRFRRATATVEV
jgi:glycosyltransferase A (GT-A) superfamily protein (DUF2064 family)